MSDWRFGLIVWLLASAAFFILSIATVDRFGVVYYGFMLIIGWLVFSPPKRR